MDTFDGKSILVTGGARGVGRAITTRLARDGAHVVVNCFHSFEQAKALQEQLQAEGARVDLLRGSVARRDQVERMFSELADLVDHLDGLVNNAASGSFAPACDTDDAVLDRALDTNLRGAWWCSRAARPFLSRAQRPAIVNLSSVGSGLVVGNYAAVGTSKAALEALTRYLAAELAADGIRVNTASGGLLDGDVARLFPDAEAMAQIVRAATPLGRLGREEELADVVAFLLSDSARWVTGQVLVADGGLSLGAAMLSAPPATRAVAPAAAEVPTAPQPVAADSTAPSPVDLDDAGLADAIAIVGAGIVAPGAADVEAYWQVLREGPELFVDARPGRWRAESFASADRTEQDKSYQGRSAYVIDDVGDDSTEEFTSRWLRRAVSEALHGVRLADDARVGCVFGYTPDGNQHLEEVVVRDGLVRDLREVLSGSDLGPEDRERAATVLDEALAHRYGRTGVDPRLLWPSEVGRRAVAGLLPGTPEILMVDTACSSSLYALDIGVKALREGRQDVAVCGGSFAVGPRNSVLFAKLNGLSVSGDVRALDEASDGVLFSDGAAVVIVKRLADARRDGDRVLGYVTAIGTSSDGKGKAIYAPSVAGQRRAVQRARHKAPASASTPSWVVAHATGTPAGDLCELTALGTELAAHPGTWVTSNKSVIGHTGWAAGAASVIQVLLAMREGTIPAQHRFTALPPKAAAVAGALAVPTQDVPWPAEGSGRVAAVSGFGFGGTNCHVLLSDAPAPGPGRGGDGGPARQDHSDLVVLAWSAQLPGLADRQAVNDWLDAAGPQPVASFGPTFTPASRTLRIPPPAQRVLDRSQLLVVACAEQLKEALGAHWDALRGTTGVFLGHMGPTRSAIAYAKRCYLDDALRAVPGGAVAAGLREDLVTALHERVRAQVPPSTEDSFPGIMPNVIAARISNYFDLHGPNMVVDTGYAATEGALEVARRYLAEGDVDIAIVGGVNGNSTPEIQALVARAHGVTGPVHEAAVLFAVTTAARAEKLGLPVLARLDATALEPGPDHPADPQGGPTYLGADGAVALLRRIHAGHAAQPAPAAGRSERTAVERSVHRHVAAFEPVRAVPTLPERALLPADAVVVTGTPAALGGLGDDPGDPLVLTSAPCPEGSRRRHVADLSEEGVRAILTQHAAQSSELRVILDLESLLPAAGALEGDWSQVAALHDLVFLVLKVMGSGTRGVLGLLLGAADAERLHPFAGLFTGLFKSAALELEQCHVASVLTTTRDLATGCAELAAEARCTGELPVALYRDGTRHVLRVSPQDVLPSADGPTLTGDDVVVAVGGGHGITAELLRHVVASARPTIHVLGSTDVEAHAERVRALMAGAGMPDRATFLRAERAAEPGLSVQAASARYDRLRTVADVLTTLADLEVRCGPGRVHYRRVDVTDRQGVADAVQGIRSLHGRIDLVIHAAGVNRASSLATKPLSAFRQVRDVKVAGYCNLRAAMADQPPRMWCNFGSFIGLTGQVGETDYAAANDFLATAAAFARGNGADEFTVGWTLWDDIGMGAHPVTRAFLAKSGVLTRMSRAEGVAQFTAELAAGNRAAASYHLGQAERTAISARMPALLTPPPARFYLDRVTSRTASGLVAERTFTAERDAYLGGHLVGGVGTLPGLFVLEIAAEAAVECVPGLVVTGFRDISFERFLKLIPSLTSSPRRIHAEVVARSDDSAVVAVEVRGDVVGPGGRVLQHDLRHFAVTVVLAAAHPPAPIWPGLGSGPEMELRDPYHAPGAPVELRDEFVTTSHTRVHPLGKLGQYRSPVTTDHPTYGSFTVPTLLLDGLARIGVLGLVAGRYIPVAAPAAIRRVDLYEPGSDADLGARHGGLDLCATPVDLDLEDAGATNRFVASAPDGRVVAQLHDVRGVVLGYVDAESGESVERAVVEAHLASLTAPVQALPVMAL